MRRKADTTDSSSSERCCKRTGGALSSLRHARNTPRRDDQSSRATKRACNTPQLRAAWSGRRVGARGLPTAAEEPADSGVVSVPPKVPVRSDAPAPGNAAHALSQLHTTSAQSRKHINVHSSCSSRRDLPDVTEEYLRGTPPHTPTGADADPGTGAGYAGGTGAPAACTSAFCQAGRISIPRGRPGPGGCGGQRLGIWHIASEVGTGSCSSRAAEAATSSDLP